MGSDPRPDYESVYHERERSGQRDDAAGDGHCGARPVDGDRRLGRRGELGRTPSPVFDDDTPRRFALFAGAFLRPTRADDQQSTVKAWPTVRPDAAFEESGVIEEIVDAATACTDDPCADGAILDVGGAYHADMDGPDRYCVDPTTIVGWGLQFNDLALICLRSVGPNQRIWRAFASPEAARAYYSRRRQLHLIYG